MTTDIANVNAKPSKTDADEIPLQNGVDEEAPGHWFHSLTSSEKRFHVLFYALAGLTGILVVQLIWQIAVLTAR